MQRVLRVRIRVTLRGRTMCELAIFSMPGGTEWIVILIIALLIFGPRLPSVMRSMGKGIVEFKKGIRDVEDQVETEIDQAVDTSAGDDKQITG